MTAETRLALIREQDPPDHFPAVEQALTQPNGLLALGGDLSVPRLQAAYAQGIFPWYGEDEPILWWSPDPRCVFKVDGIHISRRLARTMRRLRWRISMNQAFAQVVQACAQPRAAGGGTWLGLQMQAAYLDLHRAGQAHSIELWEGTTLVGGLYGVQTGPVFSAESMFSLRRDASKIALVQLGIYCQLAGLRLIDAQVGSPHLYRMGAMDIPRKQYLHCLTGKDH